VRAVRFLSERDIARPVATVLTRVVVRKDDPRMQSPSKPIGLFLSKEHAESLRQQGG
jgi:carbamate kinase